MSKPWGRLGKFLRPFKKSWTLKLILTHYACILVNTFAYSRLLNGNWICCHVHVNRLKIDLLSVLHNESIWSHKSYKVYFCICWHSVTLMKWTFRKYVWLWSDLSTRLYRSYKSFSGYLSTFSFFLYVPIQKYARLHGRNSSFTKENIT